MALTLYGSMTQLQPKCNSTVNVPCLYYYCTDLTCSIYRATLAINVTTSPTDNTSEYFYPPQLNSTLSSDINPPNKFIKPAIMSADAPPPYTRVDPQYTSSAASASYPHQTRNGIPPAQRRSMEDEARPLPEGWIRQYDSEQAHQYFVDTRTDPPRSIWHHPYDDEQFMSSQPSEERERIQSLQRVPTPADIVAEDTEDEDAAHHHAPTGKSSTSKPSTAGGSGKASASGSAALPPRKQADDIGSVHRFGRRMKDKMTSTTHDQREQQRAQRAEEERRMYETHMAYRRAMSRAMQTGQPQFLGKDRQGKDVYVQPPNTMMQGGYPGSGGYGSVYANPNARYVRPAYPYSRPYGYGYGGGLGLPLAGGLAGGLLLGGALGGFGF